MTRFYKEVERYQEEIKRLQEEGAELPYALMRTMGILKPFTVRLPMTTLAQLDELAAYGPWESKQEMVFKMIDSAIREFLDSSSEVTVKQFQKASEKSLEQWKEEQALASQASLE
jgi:hypothetical protein